MREQFTAQLYALMPGFNLHLGCSVPERLSAKCMRAYFRFLDGQILKQHDSDLGQLPNSCPRLLLLIENKMQGQKLLKKFSVLLDPL